MDEKLKLWIEKQKPTIYEIKRYTQEDSPYFFERSTLKFFKQTMKDFKVYKNGFNSWLILAKRPYGYTARLFSFTGLYVGKLSSL